MGQSPPWNISLSKALEEAFGDDADLYKNARVCMSQSYGIASCAYLRRILENRITPLLKTLREIKQAEGASLEDLQKIDAAMEKREAEHRIRLANEALPDSIKTAGGNPLSLLYDRLSDALHRRNEQECMEVAQIASKLLEYIVTNLSAARRQLREREAYEETIRVFSRSPE